MEIPDINPSGIIIPNLVQSDYILRCAPVHVAVFIGNHINLALERYIVRRNRNTEQCLAMLKIDLHRHAGSDRSRGKFRTDTAIAQLGA